MHISALEAQHSALYKLTTYLLTLLSLLLALKVLMNFDHKPKAMSV